MGKSILITGGQRSGKSSFAERMALELAGCGDSEPADIGPVYLATAHVWDAEFAKRVEIHKNRRGKSWTNIEEELYLSRHDYTGRVVLVDCLTLWATNFFYKVSMKHGDDCISDTEKASVGAEIVNETLSLLKAEFMQLVQQDATFIFVTNEIGMGGVSENAVQRQFTDIVGWFNQFVAGNCNDVYLMTSGIPMKIK